MREIVIDTETTGFDALNGDRVVEIGCIELLNHIPTGTEYQVYINPQRDMPSGAFGVHGLSETFLSDKPLFADIVDGFLDFVGDDTLVAHNASFDMGFINAELGRLKRPAIPLSQAIDTVAMARRKFPGAPASLDALCRRFAVDASARTHHGALLDAGLLAEVYLALIGGRQPVLSLAASTVESSATPAATPVYEAGAKSREPRLHAPSDDEVAAHAAFVDDLKDPLWRR